jgi:hypothetical protein
LNADDPCYQLWEKKIEDLPADKRKDIFGEIFMDMSPAGGRSNERTQL